jgi:hypothetical protein
MTQMTMFNPGARPQHLAPVTGTADITDLTAGVSSSYPVLRMKGKVWSVTMNGQTKPLVDPATGYALPAMRVVLVKANNHVSKTFYRDGYSEGADAPPDCWSFDGVKPDGSVQNACAQSCAACPNNRLGSRISDSGSRVKACPDVKRIAVMEPTSGTMMLLRLPYTSMKSLSLFAVELSKMQPPVGYNEIVTEMAFDMSKAHPEVVFKAARWLNPDEAERVADALGSPALQDILGGAATEYEAPASPATAGLGARPAQQVPVAQTFDVEEEEAPPPPPPAPKPAARRNTATAAPAPQPAPTPAPAPAAQAKPVVIESGDLSDALAQALRM